MLRAPDEIIQSALISPVAVSSSRRRHAVKDLPGFRHRPENRVITGDDDFYLQASVPAATARWAGCLQIWRSHYASGGELAHRQCRGVTFGNHYLYRRFRR